MFDRPIAFHRELIRYGGVTSALMLSQAIYWAKIKHKSCDSTEFYKSQEEWEKETGLTRWEQESARKKLVSAGVLSVAKKGIPAILHYQVNFEKLEEDFNLPHGTILGHTTNKSDEKQQCCKTSNKFVEKPQTSLRDSNKQVCGKTSNYTENTTKNTPENTHNNTSSAKADIPPKVKSDNLFSELIPKSLKENSKFLDSWREWIAHRKEIKKKLTPIAAKKQLKFLAEQPDPVACIEQSIMQGWQGLFPFQQNTSNCGYSDEEWKRNMLKRIREQENEQ